TSLRSPRPHGQCRVSSFPPGFSASLTTDTTRHTEPRFAGNLKAARRGFGGNLFGRRRRVAEAALAANDAFCENGGDLLESLLGRQFIEWRFGHRDRLRVSWPVGLCMPE